MLQALHETVHKTWLPLNSLTMTEIIPCPISYTTMQMPRGSVSLPSGRLEKTTRSSPHYVAQHRPTGSETLLPALPKQQIWLRTTLCGGWCRRMALRNVRVACQKRRRRHLIYNNYYYVIYSQFLLPFIDSFPLSSVHALNMWACPILYFFLFLIFVHFNNQTSNFWDETLLHHNIGGYTPFCLWPPAKFPDFPWPSKSVRTVIKPDRKGRKGVWTKGGADAWHHPGIWQVCLCDRGTITETHGICRPNKELQHWFVT